MQWDNVDKVCVVTPVEDWLCVFLSVDDGCVYVFQRHYQPIVRKFAAHLSHGAPSDGSGALGVNLSRRYSLTHLEPKHYVTC